MATTTPPPQPAMPLGHSQAMAPGNAPTAIPMRAIGMPNGHGIATAAAQATARQLRLLFASLRNPAMELPPLILPLVL